MENEVNDVVVYEPRQDVVIVRSPDVVLAEAQKAAKSLANVLSSKKKPVMMNGEQYLEFEDWQMVGRFYGVTAKVLSTSYIEYGTAKGFEATAVAIRADGVELSSAEAMCLNDEQNWKSKPLFQLRSMAQTRAAAKVLRNVLAWVVVLAGYRPTPAEEIQDMIKREPVKPINNTESDVPLEPGIADQRKKDLDAFILMTDEQQLVILKSVAAGKKYKARQDIDTMPTDEKVKFFVYLQSLK